LALLRAARTSLLDIWGENAYSAKTMKTTLFRRPIFICNCPEAVRHTMVDHNDRYERKSPQMRRALELLLGDGLFISDGPTWASRRRMITPILHGTHLPRFAPVMSQAAEEMGDRWAALGDGAPVDILSEMAKLTAEIICRAIFGAELGQERATTVMEAFSAYQARIGHLDLATFLNLPKWMSGVHGPAVRREAHRLHRVIEDLITEIETGVREGRSSIVSSLLTAKDPETGQGLTREQIRNEAAVLFMAGHETTATSLAWTWYLLSQDAEVEARLHEELDRVLGGRAPTLQDVDSLVYTRAVFDESLRLYPPVPVLSREALVDDRILDRPVERGSLVLIIPWLLHRHRLYWDEPDAFRPDRFLGEAREGMKDIYIPFARGPRFCAGAAFGLTEAVLCLASLAQRFRPRLANGADVYPVCRLTLRPRGGMPMHLAPRSNQR
jgi:cytochrome P450